MASKAASGYKTAAKQAIILRETATDIRLGPPLPEERQIYYHASLAACTSAWNAYIIEIVHNFFDAIANPLDPKFSSLYDLAKEASEGLLNRFNTPNWENSRNILIQCTGYDPMNDWKWYRGTRLYLNAHQTRERLNEILKVRHSFAHGFPIPAYRWTQLPSGKVRLTKKSVKDVELFFNNLVRITDREMKAHIKLTYNIDTRW